MKSSYSQQLARDGRRPSVQQMTLCRAPRRQKFPAASASHDYDYSIFWVQREEPLDVSLFVFKLK